MRIFELCAGLIKINPRNGFQLFVINFGAEGAFIGADLNRLTGGYGDNFGTASEYCYKRQAQCQHFAHIQYVGGDSAGAVH